MQIDAPKDVAIGALVGSAAQIASKLGAQVSPQSVGGGLWPRL